MIKKYVEYMMLIQISYQYLYVRGTLNYTTANLSFPILSINRNQHQLVIYLLQRIPFPNSKYGYEATSFFDQLSV